jgi:hypothetical protein
MTRTDEIEDLASPAIATNEWQGSRARAPTVIALALACMLTLASCAMTLATLVVFCWRSGCHGSPIGLTRTDARSLADVATMYVSEHPAGRCPTASELIQGRYLDRSRLTTDPWQGTFQIVCDKENVVVVSAGPDHRRGTEDDISSDQH